MGIFAIFCSICPKIGLKWVILAPLEVFLEEIRGNVDKILVPLVKSHSKMEIDNLLIGGGKIDDIGC